MWMTSVSNLSRERGGGGSDRRNAFCAHILCFEPGAVCFSLLERLKLQRLGQKLQDKASCSVSRDKGYLLPTWVRKITCWHFDWMLQSSSGLQPTEKPLKAHAPSFDRRPLPPSVYLGRHWSHSRDKNGPGLPPLFLHTAKTGRWEGLGTRLVSHL